jgi:type II secretory pathway component PulC
MKDSPSPEEKLLKLIRGEKKQKVTSVAISQEAVVDKKIISQVPQVKPQVKSKVPTLAQVKFTPHQFGAGFTPQGINKLMIVIIVASIIFLIAAFMYPIFGLSKVKLPAVTKEEGSLATQEAEADVKPLESYLEGLKSKQIFSAASTQEASTTPTSASNTMDLIKDISLVGIITSDPPQAVIEDKKTQKTYYLSNGQSIGDLKVEDIKEGKVILNYLGTNYELYM